MASPSNAIHTRVRWNDMDGKLMPTPPWAKDGMVVFRPDSGPFDVLVPKEEIEDDGRD